METSPRLSRGMPLAPSAVNWRYRFIFGRTVKRYRTQSYPRNVIVFAGSNTEKLHDARWGQIAANVEVREIDGSHTENVSVNYSRILANNIDETLGVD